MSFGLSYSGLILKKGALAFHITPLITSFAVMAIAGLVLVGIFFSALKSIFRAKYQGYPYRYSALASSRKIAALIYFVAAFYSNDIMIQLR